MAIPVGERARWRQLKEAFSVQRILMIAGLSVYPLDTFRAVALAPRRRIAEACSVTRTFRVAGWSVYPPGTYLLGPFRGFCLSRVGRSSRRP